MSEQNENKATNPSGTPNSNNPNAGATKPATTPTTGTTPVPSEKDKAKEAPDAANTTAKEGTPATDQKRDAK